MESVMDRTALFRDHVDHVVARTTEALRTYASQDAGCDGIVFHSGKTQYHHADDQPFPFRPMFHFTRFAPVPGPDHLLLVRPGAAPKLFRVVAQDFWHEPPAPTGHPFDEVLDIENVDSAEAAIEAIGDVSNCAYFGNAPDVAAQLGIDASRVEPALLTSLLDWDRGMKTAYEVDCIREACRTAADGHLAVRRAAMRGASERELFATYLQATGFLENETPYGSIIGWDENAATLHYTSKRTTKPEHGHVLLIDAGTACFGYASDVTRTYATGSAPAEFVAALGAMDDLEQELVNKVAPGVSFIDLHLDAHRGVAKILHETGIAKKSADELYDLGLTQPFLPHGLGHHLGLQVHDVGGRQKTPEGEIEAPPDKFPSLRTTRELAAGHVVTIEPGLYFIPMLLDPMRAAHPDAFDWKLVDRLVPCGGIRIEDDVLVTDSGREDLTRELIPGHREAID